jgi:uncharacterized membrane protein
MNVVISNLLKYGVILSTTLVVLGLVLIAIKTPPTFPTTVGQLVSSNYGKPTLDLGTLLSGAASGSPLFVLELGLLILLATPVVRVITSIILFAAEKDGKYVLITLIVFGILLFSILVVGPYVAGSS